MNLRFVAGSTGFTSQVKAAITLIYILMVYILIYILVYTFNI